jgi:hypothetical protein
LGDVLAIGRMEVTDRKRLLKVVLPSEALEMEASSSQGGVVAQAVANLIDRRTPDPNQSVKDQVQAVAYAQLGVENPQVYGDLSSRSPDAPADAVVRLINRLIDETVDELDAQTPAHEAEATVSAALAQAANTLRHVASALFNSAVAKANCFTMVLGVRPSTPANATEEYSRYVKALRRFAKIITDLSVRAEAMPPAVDGARELAVLPGVFQFLFERRESLRRQYYPWAGSDFKLGAERRSRRRRDGHVRDALSGRRAAGIARELVLARQA